MIKRIIEIIVLILLGGVFGCASQPLDEDQLLERDHKRQMAVNNWVYCQRVLEAHGIFQIHGGHEHNRDGSVRMAGPNGTRQAVKDDLHTNSCRQRLGEGWEH